MNARELIEAKLQETGGADPQTYRALIGEYHLGYKAGEHEAETAPYSPDSAAMNLEVGEITSGVAKVQGLMGRIESAARGGGVAVQPERFAAELAIGLSKVIYNLGKVRGLRDAAASGRTGIRSRP